MSEGTNMFSEDAKVVISPDEMRAWITLPPPKGANYTVKAVAAWLPENGVVYGVDTDLVRQAVESERYFELLEVARGKPAVAAEGSHYKLLIEKKTFSGLRGNSDGSLFYDDLSFLQEVQPGQPLAEVTAALPGQPGTTVTGKTVEPKAAEDGAALEGNGYRLSEDGRYYQAPQLSHVAIVNDRLVVTPLKKVTHLSAEDGTLEFDGNVMVEEDVLAGAHIEVTGSVFVVGRTSTATIKAGRNVLLCGGMRAEQGFGVVEAAENVWGLHFESASIKAGADVCANHIVGCEVTAGNRAAILGGRGTIADSRLYAKNGIVAVQLGNERNAATTVLAGMEADLIERFESVEKKIAKLAPEVQTLQQNITAFERINRNKVDRGKKDAAYKEMVSKKEQSLSVINILNAERTRLKRLMDQFSSVSIIVRQKVYPGVLVGIDTRTLEVVQLLNKVKFKRNLDVIDISSINAR